MRFAFLVLLLSCVIIPACDEPSSPKSTAAVPEAVDFRPDSLATAKALVPTLRGQLLYMPVYSNLPYSKGASNFDMKGYVAIHNTDLAAKIRITSVVYFDHDGRPVFDFLKGKPVELSSLATKDFQIPYEDKSGLGSNFLIEWVSDRPVTEPLVECVTVSLIPNQSLGLLSRGKVIREIR